MINSEEFKNWLSENTCYSNRVKSDIVSRVKRADNILPISVDNAYLFFLFQKDEYNCLSVSVKSQLKKAIKLYQEFMKLT